MSFKKQIKARLERAAVSSLAGIILFLPHRAALALGAFLGRLLWLLSRRKVDRGEARCVAALGLGVTLARDIVRKSYSNMGRSAVEFIRMDKLKPNLKAVVSFEGLDILDRALARGKGVLLIGMHLGSWELAAARMVMEGKVASTLYTPQRNRGGINDWILRQRSEVAGLKAMVPSEGMALREAFRVLKNGYILNFMQDLDARKDGMMVPFLGLPASTAMGVVKMHNKFGSPVLPWIIVRQDDRVHHKFIFKEILSDISDEDGNLFGVDMEKSLRMCNNVLSDFVREYPEQWTWLLDRWESVIPFDNRN